MSPAGKPLEGKSIVVTRAKEQAGELISRLESRGAEVLLIPALAFAEPTDTDLLDAALRALEKFDWILFTSENAARYLAMRADTIGLDIRHVKPMPKIAVVGPGTASAVESCGWYVTHIAKHSTSQALAEELERKVMYKRVLLPRSDLANDELPRALREMSAQVIDVVAYRTIAPGVSAALPSNRIVGTHEPPPDPETQKLERVRRGEVDVVTFASPSALRNFAEIIGAETMRKLSDAGCFAAIGPTTAKAITDAGWRTAILAAEASSNGMLEAIVAHFQRSPSGAPPS